MLASKRNGTIYGGVTANLWNRVGTHRDGGIEGFTKKYDVKNLVWYEFHQSMSSSIKREKQFKEWKRDWKIKRIIALNSLWRDLHNEINYERNHFPTNGCDYFFDEKFTK